MNHQYDNMTHPKAASPLTINRFWLSGFFFLLMLCFSLPALSADKVLYSGKWKKVNYSASGEWKIVDRNGVQYVVLGKDFSTKEGPDLQIMFSKLPLSQLTNANTNDNAVAVGLLENTDNSLFSKKTKGPQTLKIPGNIKVSDYNTILIHCVEYAHLWSGAKLK